MLFLITTRGGTSNWHILISILSFYLFYFFGGFYAHIELQIDVFKLLNR